MPVLSDMSYLFFVEKSLFFSRPSAPATLSASVGTRACLWCVQVSEVFSSPLGIFHS